MYRDCTLSLIPVVVVDYKGTRTTYCHVKGHGATLLQVQSFIDSLTVLNYTEIFNPYECHYQSLLSLTCSVYASLME